MPRSGGGGAVRRIADISLPDDGTGDVPMTADLYLASAATSRRPHQRAPLALVLPGFGGVKELFTGAAENLAHFGYAALVVQQLRNVSAPGFSNLVVRTVQSHAGTGGACATRKRATELVAGMPS
jgi:dienelactone hydrolase